MFKRFSVADDISTQTALKSSIQRAIKKSIVEQYPAVEDYIDDIIPKKGEVLEAKGCGALRSLAPTLCHTDALQPLSTTGRTA
jgi:hypothetical protein